MLYSLCFVLIAIGLYGVFVKKNVVKMLLGLMVMELLVTAWALKRGHWLS